MTTTKVYEAGPVKRYRPTKAELMRRREALCDIVDAAKPTGVRFVYYRAVSLGLYPKTEAGYNRVQNDLMVLRNDGSIPWSSIVDSSRWMRKPETWGSLDEMLADAAASYRRDLWRTADTRVEVWAESESVAGVIGSVTAKWDVPLFPIKGQTSASFAWSAAMEYKADRRPVRLYYVGDLDPAGVEIGLNLIKKLREFSARQDVELVRLACTPEQVRTMSLASSPAKKGSYFDALEGCRKAWPGEAHEVESIDAPVLRRLVDEAIRSHVDHRQLELLLSVEESERDVLRRMIGGGAR